MHVIKFPSEEKQKTKSDQLLERFVECCLITDDNKQRVEFTKLREAIFAYLSGA